jgi:hypothetical protein
MTVLIDGFGVAAAVIHNGLGTGYEMLLTMYLHPPVSGSLCSRRRSFRSWDSEKGSRKIHLFSTQKIYEKSPDNRRRWLPWIASV